MYSVPFCTTQATPRDGKKASFVEEGTPKLPRSPSYVPVPVLSVYHSSSQFIFATPLSIEEENKAQSWGDFPGDSSNRISFLTLWSTFCTPGIVLSTLYTIFSLNPHHIPLRVGTSIIPTDTERLSNWPAIAQPVSAEAQIWTQKACVALVLKHLTPYDVLSLQLGFKPVGDNIKPPKVSTFTKITVWQLT